MARKGEREIKNYDEFKKLIESGAFGKRWNYAELSNRYGNGLHQLVAWGSRYNTEKKG